MNQLHTLWTEKKYQELSQRCQKLLSDQPNNGAVACIYAGSQAMTCTLMQPTLQDAWETFVQGFTNLRKENPEPSVLSQALSTFCQALEMTDNNLEALFTPVCKYEASVEELRKCKSLLVAAAEHVLALYTPDMLQNAAFADSYLAFCRLGLQAADAYCATRGVEKITSKKTFLSANFLDPENRSDMVQRYDHLVQAVQVLKPDFVPSDTLERTQPTAEHIQKVVQDFRHYLNPEEAAIHDHAESKTEKGGFLRRLFR